MRSIKRMPEVDASDCRKAGEWCVAIFMVVSLVTAASAATSDERGAGQPPAAEEIIDEQFAAAGIEIKAAVVSGELPRAEARAAWNAARQEIISAAVAAGTLSAAEAAGYQQEINKEQLGGRLREAGARIEAAAETGEISEDEAWDEWYATKNELITSAVEVGEISEDDAAFFHHEIHKVELGDRLETAGGRIKAAVVNGEMTGEQAWAEWYATKDELIDTAVAAGEITADDATAFRGAMHQAELKERIEGAGGRIKAAVASGEMTEEEGRDEWRATREELITEAVDAGEVSEEDAADFRRGYEKAEVGRRLKAAVASGEMTEEEAWAEWAEYSNETDEVAAKIEAMVERGELSPEQAEAKLQAIESAVGQKAGAEPTKTDVLDARVVLRAAKRIELSPEQKDAVREIERETAGVYRDIRRRDKLGHTELAERVKAEIVKLLDEEQVEQFESVLARLNREAIR